MEARTGEQEGRKRRRECGGWAGLGFAGDFDGDGGGGLAAAEQLRGWGVVICETGETGEGKSGAGGVVVVVVAGGERGERKKEAGDARGGESRGGSCGGVVVFGGSGWSGDAGWWSGGEDGGARWLRWLLLVVGWIESQKNKDCD
ncbi:glycine-rich cell wall structural protein 1-like [Spinacia oleracea]|uniref:Glycine-rich cell wall structural protein 1-like n=1 Tax=Spinacia oleracea TaxID=3562 RepID=A0ABM3RSF1_SPIOL|nr:glycine-rich cell wall structural protein 1-like [Spinacia oleracea]